jgi:hypothetical protein
VKCLPVNLWTEGVEHPDSVESFQRCDEALVNGGGAGFSLLVEHSLEAGLLPSTDGEKEGCRQRYAKTS